MAALLPLAHRTPPSLYRFARLLRRLGAVALVLVVLFLASVVYSAVLLAESTPQSSGYTAAFGENDTVAVTGSVALSNPGYYPLQGFGLSLRILNNSGLLLGDLHAGPETIPSSATTSFPFALYLPIASTGPAESLLTEDQYLTVNLWANATYAYLFPLSVHLSQNKFWGAPFALLKISPGAPTSNGDSVTVPVTISFTNHASFPEVGNFSVVVYPASGPSCGADTFLVNVPPGDAYDQTQNLVFSSACNPAGGNAQVTFTGPEGSIAFPPEALP